MFSKSGPWLTSIFDALFIMHQTGGCFVMCPWSASRGHNTSDSVTVYKAKIATPDLMKENKDVLGILSYVLNTGQWLHSVLFNRTANVNVIIFIWENFPG